MKKIFSFIILSILSGELSAQVFFKRDDFIGSLERRWWHWHNDPEQIPGIATSSVNDGYSTFTLTDAIINPFDPFYCDAALWDGFPFVGGPYNNVYVKMRIRATTPMQDGSIGWGLWYTEGNFAVSQLLWFMQSQDLSGGSGENWWIADKVNGPNDPNREIVDLEPTINTQEWHVYEIDRQDNYVNMIIDGQSVLYSENNLPTADMAFHIWVDNKVYVDTPGGIVHFQKAWTGTSELLMDYVQILPEGIDIDHSEAPDGIKLLRQVPNDIYSETQPLWKDYSFNSSSGGNFVFLITGRAEFYAGESPDDIDDDMRFIIDGTDYGWNTVNSFNGEAEGTVTKTIMFEQNIGPGTADIEVYADISPLLYDVTVLGSQTGSVLFEQEYNEVKSGVSDELWHEISFSTAGGEVAIYVSGSADEDLFPFSFGNNRNFYEDNVDDDLKLVLDGFDYGYQTEQSLFGNQLFGDPKSILLTENLAAGDHTLQIYGLGTPTLYRVVIYGNSPETSLPVSLTSFKGNVLPESNHLEWITESEINNFGFNLYRAQSALELPLADLEFMQINDQIISGAGNSSVQKTYTYKDEDIKSNTYYWYRLEDVDYQGQKTSHNVVSLQRDKTVPGKFMVYNNYPNPFNGSTQISFYLESDSPVQASFFNSKGQLVQKLDAKIYSQGLNKITWNGNNLTSGIYYCNISAFQTSQTIKMLHVK